jgi:hypothetical protein
LLHLARRETKSEFKNRSDGIAAVRFKRDHKKQKNSGKAEDDNKLISLSFP